MNMIPIVFGVVTFVSTVLGGLFAIRYRKRFGILAAFAAGVLISVSLFDLLSEAAVYATSKAGVIMLTKVAARQYAEFGIRVNAICPGYHRTNLHPEGTREQIEAGIPTRIPIKRIALPGEIKGWAVWLASDASSFVTQGRPLFARVAQGAGGTSMVDLGPPTPLRRDATSAIKKWRDCETRGSGCGNSQCLGPSSGGNRESIGR